ncbi:Glycoside Hydrolase, partial [Rhizoctonia solani]
MFFALSLVITLFSMGWSLPLPYKVRQAEGEKFVVAHHMVGNTFPYTYDTWLADVKLAHANGIDAFALNVGTDSWQKDRVKDAFDAARDSGTGFKMFMSFDMAVNPCAGPSDAAALREYITTYASHSAQLRYNGKVFASTFAGESCTFGAATTEQGWKEQFTDQLTGENAALFVPSFFMDPARFKSFSAMDGAFNWNGGWPTQLSAAKLSQTISFLNSNPVDASKAPIPVPPTLTPIAGVVSALSTLSLKQRDDSLAPVAESKLAAALAGAINLDSDTSISANLGTSGDSGAGTVYMACVSPWFYTHYGPDSFNKNWIYRSDDWLYNTRWDQLIRSRDKIDIVQIVSWNDYGESHYIGPIEGAQPNSNAWVDGFDHQAWLQMTSYYATAFKTGQYPTIEKDQIFLTARPHPAHADASDDPVGKPTDFELTEDALWAVVFATAPAKVTLSADPTKPEEFDVPAGVSKLRISLVAGQGIAATMARDGATLVDMKPDFYFDPNPTTYNYNAATFTGTAERASHLSMIKLNSGDSIPAVGLGCWMGSVGGGEQAYEMVKLALRLGYRHFDTASRYGNEEGVGRAIRESGIPRSKIFVTTKLVDWDHDNPKRGLEGSLMALGLDYIDLYLMHWPMARVGGRDGRILQPDESPTFVETWLAMEKLLDTGKVKNIGISNFSIQNINVLLEKAKVIPVVNQVELHPCYPQNKLIEFCRSKGIYPTAYCPLGQYRSPFFSDPVFIRAAEQLSKELSREVTPSQLVLSWAVQRGTIIIPKSSNESRLKQNLDIITLPKAIFEIVDNYHKGPGMHKTLDEYTLREPGTVGGWTYEQMGWSLDREGSVVS